MAHYSQKTKDAVRKKYIFGKLSLTSVSVEVEVPYQTCARWKKDAKEKGDDWDKVKAAHTMAGGNVEDISRQLMTEFVVQYKTTMDTIKEATDMPPSYKVTLLASLSDSYIKMVNANKKLMPETSKLAVALQVLEKLAKYIQKNKLELLADFMEILEDFGKQIEQELK